MKKITFILIGLALLFHSCATEMNRGEPQDGDIVVNVDGHTFTRYELKMFIQNGCMEDEDKTVTRDNMNCWLDQFGDYTLLVAEAYNRHYDTRDNVRLLLDHYSKFIAVQQDGPLYKAINEPYLHFTEQDVLDTYEKQNQVFVAESITVDTTWYAEHGVGLNFDKLVSRVLEDSAGRYSSIRMVWPFTRLYGYRDTLFRLEPGQESPVMTLDNRYIKIRLTNKEPNTDLQEFEAEKPVLEQTLLMFARMWREAYNDSVMAERLQYEINESVAEELFHGISNYEEYHVPEETIADIADEPLATYTLLARDTLTVGEFLNRYNHSIIRDKITSRDILHKQILSYLFLDGYWQYAQELGVLDDPAFKLELQYREHEFMYQALKKDMSGEESMPDLAFLGAKDTQELLGKLRETYPVENNIDAEYFLSEDTLSFLQAHIDSRNRSAAGAGSVPDNALQRRQPEGVGVGAEPADLSGADRSGD